jgi:predicted dithiol-disulfide oxidoreductase (DUF899 family)
MGEWTMENHRTATRADWIEARKQLLADEKEFTRLRDDLNQRRRDLPWVLVDKQYAFEGPDGKRTLTELFEGRSQLVVYHFMFAPDWEVGCKSCSFWADNFNGIVVHLNQRDVTFLAVSRAPLAKLQAFAKRLGWSFPWVSSFESDFNFDYHVSFRPEELSKGEVMHNFAMRRNSMSDLAGISVFCKDEAGNVFHTYSCYARGLDMMNTSYHYLDLTPKGRDEAGLPHTMSWVRLHDQYGQ